MEEAQLELSARLNPAEISGDRALIERLVANLIDNAVDYNHAGGTIEIWTASDAGRAILGIVNTGPPISAEEVERLFEPFRRQRSDRSGPADGHHGLGLSIVRAVAEAHNASLTAAPGPHGGLAITIAFDLPAQRHPAD
jgi:signal transduction histidine kinase